jgi:hypothetical protein
MKQLKRILSLALAVALVLSLTGIFASAVDEDEVTAVPIAADLTAGETEETEEAEEVEEVAGITVSVRIEGQTENLFYNAAVKLVEGEAALTVLDLVTVLNESEDAPEFTLTESDYGAYISAIEGLAEATNAATDGWQYLLNGVAPVVGINAQELADGDSVVFYYSDEYGIGFNVPIIDITEIADGVITFTSSVTSYDEEGTATTAIVPIVGANVTIGDAAYTTDEDGKILIDVAAGYRVLQIEKTDFETGIPLVLRLAPDYEIFVPFTDTVAGAWYDAAVKYVVKAGLFQGNENNTFTPDQEMTLAELTQVLYRVAGGVKVEGGEFWYTGAANWADESGIIPADSFKPDAIVEREDFIYLFYATIKLVGERDTEATTDITAATDYADITEGNLEAIAWAVASNLIKGVSGETLTVNPRGIITRAEVSQLLTNYYTAA